MQYGTTNSRNFEFSLGILDELGLVAYHTEDLTVMWGRNAISRDVHDGLLFKDIG